MAQAPLQFLDRFIGGSWHYLAPEGGGALSMVHTFSWQVDGFLLYSKSVSPSGTSYSYWYWHPTQERVKAISVGKALEASNLAEYTEVKMEGETMVCALTTHDAEEVKQYREEWVFPNADHYHWKLFALSDGGEQEIMQARFERRKE